MKPERIIEKFNFKIILFVLFIHGIFGKNLLYSQQLQVKGIVTDSLQNPLSYANIIAFPLLDGNEIKFSVTENDGSYELGLIKNLSYEIKVSYLGYKPETLVLIANQDLVKNFILEVNPDLLDEITLNYVPPVTIKKDTITYKVDSFKTGKERKLGELLKKLPGVEVDRAGNVTVQGKQVTKVLIEDKIFFTGDSKLAVNNIPADAVDKIVVLDNYSEIAMLKGLEDSEDMAMNIKLKEDKKKFAFGDIEAGGGVEKRYLIHPNLFYYSPKTNINLIGDLNNQGIKSFSFKDYLDFEGGFSKFMDNVGGYLTLTNDDFAQYLTASEFTENINRFGALNVRQSINSVTDINSYVIYSDTDTRTLNNSLNAYQFAEDPFLENRETRNKLDNNFTIGKVSFDYKPSFGEEFSANSFLKATRGNSLGQIVTQSPELSNQITTDLKDEQINLKQNLNYSLELSKSHTATLESTYIYDDQPQFTQWVTDREILQGLLPLEDSEEYKIEQDKRIISQNLNFFVKDYWVINRFNHLYTTIGFNLNFNELFSREYQVLNSGEINDFNSAIFGNDLRHSFANTFMGLEYKFQIGIATFKPMLYYHYYTWQTLQENRNVFKTNLVLPSFTGKIDFNNSEKINFRYNLKPQFPGLERLASNFILSDFNRVYRGNDRLENTLAHSASLTYYKFSLFRNLNLNLGANYNKRVSTLKNVVELDGIESFSTPIIFERPEESFSLNGRITKKIKKIRYKLDAGFNYMDFYQLLNNTENLNVSKTYSSAVGIETFFKNWPNVELEYSKDFSDYSSIGGDTEFINDNFSAFLEHRFLKDFVIKADYTFESFNNKSQNITNTFNIANASLFYQKEDSPWGFEITGSNLFDIKFKQRNSFNNFIISDSKTFIMPRIIMAKIIYKL